MGDAEFARQKCHVLEREVEVRNAILDDDRKMLHERLQRVARIEKKGLLEDANLVEIQHSVDRPEGSPTAREVLLRKSYMNERRIFEDMLYRHQEHVDLVAARLNLDVSAAVHARLQSEKKLEDLELEFDNRFEQIKHVTGEERALLQKTILEREEDIDQVEEKFTNKP